MSPVSQERGVVLSVLAVVPYPVDGPPALDAKGFPFLHPESRVPLATFTIATTEANELMRPIHDRMPLILSPAHVDECLASAELPATPEFLTLIRRGCFEPGEQKVLSAELLMTRHSYERIKGKS